MFKITEYVNASSADVECEEEIIKTLAENPGIRMRDVAFIIHKDPVQDVLPALHRLKAQGKVKSISHKDIANMEFYDEWYVNC